MGSPIIFKGANAKMLNSGGLEFKNGMTIEPYAGNPNGVITRTKGSLIQDKTNAQVYINTTGAAIWKALSQDDTAATLEFSGFTNQDYVNVAYDSTAMTITLTGVYDAYWLGQKLPSLATGFVSPAHVANLDVVYYLYYDAGGLTWDTNPWTFDKLQIAYVYYGTTDKFALRETHGLMQWETHRELHTTIGTYRYSGGDETAVILNDVAVASRRPSFLPLYIMDEDLKTSVNQLPTGTYTRAWLTGAGVMNFAKAESEIIALNIAQPYYNEFTATWGQTPLTENQHTCVWVIALPTASDTDSQAYRYLFLQGQTAGSLASQQVREPSNVEVGNLASLSPEFCFVHKFILKYVGGDWVIVESTPLAFNRASITGTTGVYWATTENVDLIAGNTAATAIKTVQDVISHQWSSGRVDTAPTITDNGDNTVDVSTCEVMLRDNNSSYADLRLWKLTAITNQSVPLETTRYVVADFSGGAPVLAVRTPGSSGVNNKSVIAMAVLVNAGGTIHRTDFGDNNADVAQRLAVYLGTRYGQVARLSGATPTSPAGRYVALTSGSYAIGFIPFTVALFDTTGADRFTSVYGDAVTGWTRTAAVAQLTNTHYWNPSTHLLTALSSSSGGFYTCWWIFQLVDTPNKVVAFLHTAQSNSIATIRSATITTDVPIELTNRIGPSTLIAKIIVRQGQANAQEVINIVSADSQQTPTSDHNSLGGLDGGTVGQYYHLTSAQHTIATQAASGSLSGYVDTTVQTFAGDKTFSGAFKASAGFTLAYRSMTATGAILTTDHYVDIDHAATAIEATLPTAGSVAGKIFVLTRVNLATVRILCTGVETINGSTFLDLPNMYSSVSIHSNGTNWIIH